MCQTAERGRKPGEHLLLLQHWRFKTPVSQPLTFTNPVYSCSAFLHNNKLVRRITNFTEIAFSKKLKYPGGWESDLLLQKHDLQIGT